MIGGSFEEIKNILNEILNQIYNIYKYTLTSLHQEGEAIAT